MATIAPWLKGPDVLQSMSRGADVGLKRQQLREQARANTLRHMAAMAGIRERSRVAQERTDLAQKGQDDRRAQAAQDLLMQRAGLEQRADLAAEKKAFELEKLNRPKYMNVAGGIAQTGPGGPEFIENPYAGAGDLDIEAWFNPGSGGGAAAPSGGGGQWDAIDALVNAKATKGRAPADSFNVPGTGAVSGREPRNKTTIGDLTRYVLEDGKLVRKK